MGIADRSLGNVQPSRTQPELAVVIPYFQRQPGILRRSLESVFAQRDAPPLRIIIVDDGSPSSVDLELESFEAADRDCVTVLKQRNQGPGPARNAGLAAVPASVDLIAFLDSDDIWRDDHLSVALAALNKGFDLFFADGTFASGSSRFTSVGFVLDEAHELDTTRHLYAFSGDLLAEVLNGTSPIVTSSVVLRRQRLGLVRFPSIRGICEDLCYWLDVARFQPRVAFSTAVHVTGGRDGVHVSHVYDWRSNKALTQAAGFCDYYRHVLAHIPLSVERRAAFTTSLVDARTDFVMTVLAMLRQGKRPDFSVLVDFAKRNPAFPADVGRAVRRLLASG